MLQIAVGTGFVLALLAIILAWVIDGDEDDLSD